MSEMENVDQPDYESGCLFCKIVKREIKSYTFWENENYMAFLTPFPNTKGASVVIPKKHISSYAFEAPDELLAGLVIVSKIVGKILDDKLAGVGRTAMVFEGFGINHLHAKLFPMHGTKEAARNWNPIKSSVDKYFDQYEGYISSHDGKKADDFELESLATLLKQD